MPKLEFTTDELKAYFNDDENGRHCHYKCTVENAEAMAVHADGTYPCELLDARRPNEPQEVMDYRKTIFVPKTKPYFGKIVSSLSKIRRSSDWSIRYEGDFPRIPEGETLEDYCELNFPKFKSITNWIYSLWLKKYLVDPNAVIFVYPDKVLNGTEIKENEFLKPFPYVFDSCHVVDYVDEDFAVLVNPEGCVYYNSKGPNPGKSFYVITTERILRYDQIDGKGNFAVALDYIHGLEMLPVYKIGAIITNAVGDRYLYESRISGVLAEFDEAIREYSDLQASVVTSMYAERWEFTQHECTECKGTGKRRNPHWHPGCDASICDTVECDNKGCHNGYIVAGPYSKILVRPSSNPAIDGIAQIPTPPAGYIQKDVDIVKLQDDRVEKHIYNALAAINFEFLMMTPLNQSGTAKEVDKDELNNTVHAIAEDMVRNMDWVYWVTAKYRYKVQYKDDDLETMVPTVSVPEKYDILSSTHLEAQITAAKTNKSNPVIVNALEVEYANKAFNSDPAVRDMVDLVLKLDPLANITEDDKMTRLSNRGITQQTYIISSNINEFVQRALDEDENFPDLELEKQKEKMKEYAGKIEKENEALKIEMDGAGLEEDIEGNPEVQPFDTGVSTLDL